MRDQRYAVPLVVGVDHGRELLRPELTSNGLESRQALISPFEALHLLMRLRGEGV